MRIVSSLSAISLALVVSAAPAVARPVSEMDRDFLVTLQQMNLAELAGADYAIAHSNSPRIDNYALTIRAGHTIGLKDTETYARGAGVELPTAPTDEQVAEQQQLEKLSGTAFENAYLVSQIAGHEKLIELDRREARYGSDANISSLARLILSALEYHLHLAKETLASLHDPIQSGELSPPRG